MKNPATLLNALVSVLLASALIMGSPLARADNDKGKGKGHGKGNAEHRDGDRDRDGNRRDRFDDRHRVLVQEFYTEEVRGGRCPPGLAKKNNDCQPPGQAKKWRLGQPLPRDVVYYDLPPQLVVKIGVPPPGYKYVRVAGDILKIAVGTALVVDAIQDLGRL